MLNCVITAPVFELTAHFLMLGGKNTECTDSCTHCQPLCVNTAVPMVTVNISSASPANQKGKYICIIITETFKCNDKFLLINVPYINK